MQIYFLDPAQAPATPVTTSAGQVGKFRMYFYKISFQTALDKNDTQHL